MSLFEGPSLLCLEETKLQDDDEAPRLKQHTTTVSNRSHTVRHRPSVRGGSSGSGGGSGSRYLQLLHVTEAQLLTEYQQSLKFNRHRWNLRKPYCQMLDSKLLVFAVKCIEVLLVPFATAKLQDNSTLADFFAKSCKHFYFGNVSNLARILLDIDGSLWKLYFQMFQRFYLHIMSNLSSLPQNTLKSLRYMRAMI